MTRQLTARAPVRLDFGGGWTDVPPYCEEQGGMVCSVAIARYATATLSARLATATSPDAQPVPLDARGDEALALAAMRRTGVLGASLSLSCDYPLGAGLGGSSAAGVAALGVCLAWRGEHASAAELAEASRALEVDDLRIAGGRQDHYAAAMGGALALRFGTGVEAERIALSPSMSDALERRCLVVYTGASRISGQTITAVLDAYRARERRVFTALAEIRRLAQAMAAALAGGDVDLLGQLVGEHWTHQRALHASISTPLIDEILARAQRAGALGGKALGASGVGCVLVIAGEQDVEPVRQAIAALAEPLPFRLDHHGFQVLA